MAIREVITMGSIAGGAEKEPLVLQAREKLLGQEDPGNESDCRENGQEQPQGVIQPG